MSAHAPIVVGFDDHEAARRALQRAIELAGERRTGLVILVVAELPLDPGGPRTFGTLDDGPVAKPGPTPDLERALARARQEVAPAGIRADYLWAAGDPARALVDVARDRGAAAIVIGAHHRGLLAKVFGLTVEDAVRREADCDVLVVE